MPSQVIVAIEDLRAIGRVTSSGLAAEGIWLEVIQADDVNGRWKRDYSRWPPDNRPPTVEKPDIVLAIRSNYGGLAMKFLSAAGEPLPQNPHMIGGPGGPNVFYWVADGVVDSAVSLRIEVMRD